MSSFDRVDKAKRFAILSALSSNSDSSDDDCQSFFGKGKAKRGRKRKRPQAVSPRKSKKPKESKPTSQEKPDTKQPRKTETTFTIDLDSSDDEDLDNEEVMYEYMKLQNSSGRRAVRAPKASFPEAVDEDEGEEYPETDTNTITLQLIVPPDLLSKQTLDARHPSERGSAKTFKFKIRKSQPFEVVAKYFLKADNSSLQLEDLALLYFRTKVQFASTPTDEAMVDNDELELALEEKETVDGADGDNDAEFVPKDIDSLFDKPTAADDSEDHLRLKIKFRDRTELTFRMKHTDKFEKIYAAIGKHQQLNAAQKKKLRLDLDGDKVAPNSTPGDHDLEDDDVLDALF
mmetsp:Transcript_4244/g.11860  ORF Transcript_4244/g.11860 Transcript_4244/m.11860 type:complete len:345 (+) Transcript_4244:162-1196(+)|eukprot:CAMPEP_0119128428 /NCGR_PEP_ID=MMETSP1310-20130426/6590_1 /TAXON_ID=464262 /ORGANISM="Genus nov. species nov., Strain RCC2339" /LENGTH=344 /DNA_ID=CAMNT_0007118769 /DNA_START=116 /DNA_END=1150 /DNA_ORIENTATION=+